MMIHAVEFFNHDIPSPLFIHLPAVVDLVACPVHQDVSESSVVDFFLIVLLDLAVCVVVFLQVVLVAGVRGVLRLFYVSEVV